MEDINHNTIENENVNFLMDKNHKKGFVHDEAFFALN